MNKYLYGAIILGALVTIVAVNRPSDTSDVKAETDTVESSIKTKTEKFGVVEVEITPIKLSSGDQIILKAALNNHSVDLSYNWENVVTLKDDIGNSYELIDWTGNSGGHHLSGEFVFSELKPEAQELTLLINGIDGATKSLVWNINE